MPELEVGSAQSGPKADGTLKVLANKDASSVRNQMNEKFYDLADYRSEKRHPATIELLKLFPLDQNYCLARLVNGLASPRAATRLGFSVALAFILREYGQSFSAESLFAMTDDKSNLVGNAQLIGQHFLHIAMVNSDAYSEALPEIVRREIILMNKKNQLEYAVCDLIAVIAGKMDTKSFKHKIWPVIKKETKVMEDQNSPELLYLIVSIAINHPEIGKQNLPLLTTEKETAEEIDYKNAFKNMVETLKKTNDFAIYPMLMKIIKLSRSSGNFQQVYNSVFEDWLYHGDSHKVVERVLHVTKRMLTEIELKPSEMLVICSEKFINMVRSVKKLGHLKLLLDVVMNILKSLDMSLDGNWTMDELNSLLSALDRVDNGNFDGLYPHLKITTKILKRLEGDFLNKYIEEALENGGWRLKRIETIFPSCTTASKKLVLQNFMKHNAFSQEMHDTFCYCIASMMNVSMRIGKSVKANFDEEHKKVLKKLLNKYAKADSKIMLSNNVLDSFKMVLEAWNFSLKNTQEMDMYSSMIEEIIEIDSDLGDGDCVEDLMVLCDLLLSVLSQPHRYCRLLVQYIFASMLPKFDTSNILHIAETVNLSDAELLQDGPNQEEAVNSDDDIDDVDDDNEREIEVVDEEIDDHMESNDIEESDDDDKQSLPSTLGDEEMFKLDEKLSAVFRMASKGVNAMSSAKSSEAEQFRAKCFDLLYLAISHDETKFKAVDLIFPFLEMAKQAVRMKNGELNCRKSIHLIKVIIENKKSELTVSKSIEMLNELTTLPSDNMNPALRSLAGDISSFLFSSCYNGKDGTVAEEMSERINELFTKFMTDRDFHVADDIVMSPIIKFPQALLSMLPHIIDSAFDDNLRIYQKTQALACAIGFMKKHLVRSSERNRKLFEQIWSKISVSIGKYLDTLELKDSKPHFLVQCIGLMSTLANIPDDVIPQKVHNELHDRLSRLLAKFDELSGDDLKRFNSAAQKICKRNIKSSISHVQSLLKENPTTHPH